MEFKWFNIQFFAMKAHYFLLFGSMGGAVPFMQVIGKKIGIDATGVGIIYTVLPACVFLTKPAFGYLADRTRSIRVILMVLIGVSAITFLPVLFIPSIRAYEAKERINVQASCVNTTDDFNIELMSQELYSVENFNRTLECEILNPKCKFGKSSHTLRGNLIAIKSETITHAIKAQLGLINQSDGTNYRFILRPDDTDVECDCLTTYPSILKCDENFHSTDTKSVEKSEYKTFSFWAFIFLTVVSGASLITSFGLSDASCFEALQSDSNLFGKQRLWGAIGRMLVSPLVGYLNNEVSGMTHREIYLPGFCIMIGLVIIDLVVVSRLHLPKVDEPLNIWKDVGMVFSSLETAVFSSGVLASGIITVLTWNYLFWYIQDIGGSLTLLGLSIAVQCAVEIPFFFYSDWILKKLGHFGSMSLSLLTMAVRSYCYYVLQNPWMTLLIEILNGITFCVTLVTISSYATERSSDGTKATMLGVFGSLFEGLGGAIGSLLGGMAMDKYGGRMTFYISFILGIVCFLVFSVVSVLMKVLSSSKKGTFNFKESNANNSTSVDLK